MSLFIFHQEPFRITVELTVQIYMYKTRSKILLIAMMLVAFVWQAMAYNVSIPCEFSVSLHSSVDHSDEELHDESEHGDTEHGDSDCCEDECCDTDCLCPSNWLLPGWN